MKSTSKVKLLVAKAWVVFCMGLLVAALAGLLTLAVWGLISVVPAENLFVLGIILAGVAVIAGIAFLFEKADRYIDNNGGWGKK